MFLCDLLLQSRIGIPEGPVSFFGVHTQVLQHTLLKGRVCPLRQQTEKALGTWHLIVQFLLIFVRKGEYLGRLQRLGV